MASLRHSAKSSMTVRGSCMPMNYTVSRLSRWLAGRLAVDSCKRTVKDRRLSAAQSFRESLGDRLSTAAGRRAVSNSRTRC